MTNPLTSASIMPAVRLGIRGLPNLTDNMISGGLYVLIAETPSARFPILAGNLGNALKNERPCSVIVPSQPELFLQRIEALEKMNAAALIASSRLQVFVMQEEFSKKMFRFGADAFVQELEKFEIPENSYLLFDQADELLSLHDITLALDQINILKNWFAQQRVTALLVFSRANDANSGAINALMDSMSGIARLFGDRDGLELTFDYWQSPEGTIAARNYRLSTLASGLYEATTPAEPFIDSGKHGVAEVKEDAEPYYFYMNPDLGSLAKQMPGIWKRVDTLVGMMHATHNTRSSTSILMYQRDTNLRQLAETVHTLRLSLGRHAKIIVQEKDASLRYQNEAFLLKLGLNLVVHREVSASRLPLLLESLNGQVFSRDVDINFEAAMASVLPATASGYVLPSRFVREVQSILERAVTLDIPCAMVVGKPAQHTSVIDILKSSGLSRPGDLITSDGECCYLFLNACPESVLLKTLSRVLRMPLDTAFDHVEFLIRGEEIQPVLAALMRHGDQPDYSPMAGVRDVAATAHLNPWIVAEIPVAVLPEPSKADSPGTLHIMPMASVFHDAEPAPGPRVSVLDTPVLKTAVTATPVSPPVTAVGTPPASVRETFSSSSLHAGAPVPGVKKVARATRSTPVNL